MNTLLDKVRALEEQAEAETTKAEAAGQQALQRLTADEGRVIADVRAKAEEKAKNIVNEHVNRARADVNAMHQEEEQAESMVKQAADANRERAITRALDLFADEYLTD